MLPDTPVLNEAGIPLAAFIGRGIGVPAGTPDEVAKRLESALRAVAEDEDFRDQAEARGYHVVWHAGSAWMAEMQAELDNVTVEGLSGGGLVKATLTAPTHAPPLALPPDSQHPLSYAKLTLAPPPPTHTGPSRSSG